MVKEIFSIEIYGDNFSPAKVEQTVDLTFSNKNEIGEIGKLGRYKNLPIPYGSATIKNSENASLASFLMYFRKYITIIRQNGGKSIYLNCGYFYSGQCNCELGIEEIALLNEMKIPFIFSVYEDEKLPDE